MREIAQKCIRYLETVLKIQKIHLSITLRHMILFCIISVISHFKKTYLLDLQDKKFNVDKELFHLAYLFLSL